MARPMTRQTKTAKMMRAQRSASHRITSTIAIVTVAFSAAFSLMVENSSSAIGTGPVSRSRAWYLAADVEIGGGLTDGVGRAPAGLELGVIERRLDFEETQPFARCRGAALDHFVPGEARRLAGVDVLDRIRSERHRPLHIVERELTALHAEQAELKGLDDAAQRRIAGQDLNQALRLRQHFHLRLEILDRLEQQAVLRERTARLWAAGSSETNSSAARALPPRRWSRHRQARASAHRRPRRSTEIAETPSRIAASRCRQSMFGEMSWLTSVVMAKCVAAYQDDSTASSSDSPMTGQAFFAQKPMARTTRAVIVFMREWVNGIAIPVGLGDQRPAFEALRPRRNGGRPSRRRA